MPEANGSVKVNRKYKDRLFRLIFGAEENKKYLLSLYNAINHSAYENPDDIEITTLEDVIYIKQKNDVSFLLGSELSLYEQQSSFNPNMPLRGMMYFADLYRQNLSGRKRDIYSSTLVKLPTPKYIVFFNGAGCYADSMELKLSDAFEKQDTSGRYEWTAEMININEGHNKELLEQCKALGEYSSFVSMIRKNRETMDVAVKENYLDGFFKKHREGVIDVSLTEYNEEEFIENRKEEGRVEGRIEGRIEALLSNVVALMSNLKMTFEQACEALGISAEDSKTIKAKL